MTRPNVINQHRTCRHCNKATPQTITRAGATTIDTADGPVFADVYVGPVCSECGKWGHG